MRRLSSDCTSPDAKQGVHAALRVRVGDPAMEKAHRKCQDWGLGSRRGPLELYVFGRSTCGVRDNPARM